MKFLHRREQEGEEEEENGRAAPTALVVQRLTYSRLGYDDRHHAPLSCSMYSPTHISYVVSLCSAMK